MMWLLTMVSPVLLNLLFESGRRMSLWHVMCSGHICMSVRLSWLEMLEGKMMSEN